MPDNESISNQSATTDAGGMPAGRADYLARRIYSTVSELGLLDGAAANSSVQSEQELLAAISGVLVAENDPEYRE